ncbi:MAG TPA: 1-acyl-sn-glycerol-3-phosphate acyltransferase [Jatrophihabitans sp.]|nr:1-acyl-sn-glycerol-3-phosphate acyltransferase [Jatrophihabitans sp.]
MSWLPPRPVRRVVIDPLWPLLAAFLLALVLVVLALSALLTPFSRRRRVLRASMLAALYLCLDVGLVLSSFRLWLQQLGRRRDEQAWRQAHAALLAGALSRLSEAAGRWFGYRIELVGRDIGLQPDGPLLMLARHAGPGDSFSLVHLLLTRYQRIPRVVLKQALQWDPGLDVVLTRLRCYFLPSKSGAGEDRAAAVAAMVAEMGRGDALLLFPEGGNWTPRRHRRAIVRLRRSGRVEQARRAAAHTNVLPPRPGGTSAALAVRPDTDVVVVAHAGLDTLVNPRQIWQALPLTRRPMRVRAWLHPAAEVPRDERAVQAWLDEQWAAVDQWVQTQPRHD